MHWLRLVYFRVYGLLFKNRVERDMEEEMNFHIRMRAALNAESGMPGDEARRQASRSFGNVDLVKEYSRDFKGGGMLETTLKDLGYGLRMLRKSPAFTVVAVLTLGLGIGANSAIFSVINGILLRPLPFDEPDRLVRVYATAGANVIEVTSFKDLDDWREQNDVFEQLAIFSGDNDSLGGPDGPESTDTADVSPGFFEMLRVKPILGRTFSDADKPGHRMDPNYPITGADGVVILGEHFWRQRCGSDPSILGTTLTVDGYPSTVIGVVPDGFETLVGHAQLWFPYAPNPKEGRDSRHLPIIGRLKPGVSLQQASAEMAVIASRLQQMYPEDDLNFGATVSGLQETIVGNVRLTLLIVFGAVGLVLLIACANVANLLLARAAARGQEMAIRSALGAGRARLTRQLLTEGLMLAALGCLVALPLASAIIRFLIGLAPRDIPRVDNVGLDDRVIGFTILLSFFTSLVFGLAPSLRLSGTAVGDALKEIGRSTSGGRRHSQIRSLLVVSELAISTLLLIGSGLLIRSFYQLRSVNPGFDPRNVTTAEVDLPENMDKGRESRTQFYDSVRQSLDRMPGISTAVGCWLPLSGGGSSWEGAVPEGRAFARAEFTETQYRRISPGYFRTMQIPFIAGRDFDDSDGRSGDRVIIVSQSMARKLWPGEDPIGKRLQFGLAEDGNKPVPYQVVGLVGDVKWWRLEGAEDMGSYVPVAQDPMPFLNVAVRAEANRAGLAQEITGAVHSISKDLPVIHIRTMDQILDNTLAGRRFTLILICLFAGLALVLATVGTYGVISYSVAERTREVGIRMALGADRKEVVRLVVSQAARLAVIGVALGLAAAFASTRVMESLLFKVSRTDPPTFAAISAILILVSLVASYMPARRAARIDPMAALRCE
jgi:putative ABC transport system permease protein